MKGKQSLEQIVKAGVLGCKVQRDAALEKYYKNPNYCLNCNKIIEVKGNQRVCEVKKHKFCNKSCAAQYNNIKSPKKIKIESPQGICAECGDIIYYIRNKKTGYFYKKKLCQKCNLLSYKKNGEKSKDKLRIQNGFITHEVTKGFLRDKFGKEKAGNYIGKHARRFFASSGLEYKCVICGYDKHIQIAHIKAIADFDDNTLVVDINNINNLIALCPNHHWELDNDHMDENDKIKMNSRNKS